MSEIELITKVCNKCGEEKPLSDFWRSKKGRSGRRESCRGCLRPLVDASKSRRRELIGDDAYKANQRQVVARGRQSGTVDPRPNKAGQLALKELARRHPDELRALTRLYRAELGLNPEPNRHPTQISAKEDGGEKPRQTKEVADAFRSNDGRNVRLIST